MQQVQGTAPRQPSHRLAGISSMVGTTIEWYDFFIYGAAAALIFNKLFFPNLDPLSGVLAAFAAYGIPAGYLGLLVTWVLHLRGKKAGPARKRSAKTPRKAAKG